MIFDQYSRYRACADLLKNAGFSGNEEILDVGSGPECLFGRFFETAPNITFLDPLIEVEDRQHISSDVFSDSLSNRSFDFVLAVDVLEHIPSDSRLDFIDRIAHLASKGVVLGFPSLEQDAAHATDIEVNRCYRDVYGNDYPWLDEHFKYGLPSAGKVREFFEQQSWYVQEVQHGHAPWLQTLLGDVTIYWDIPALHEEVLAASQRFADRLMQFDFTKPCYRTFLVATKAPLPPIEVSLASPSDWSGAQQEFDDLVKELRARVSAISLVELKRGGALAAQLHRKIADVSEWGQSTAKVVEERDALIRELQRQVQDVSSWGGATAKAVEERDSLIRELHRQVEETSTREQSNLKLAEERDASIRELQRQVEDVSIRGQSNVLAIEERDALIKELQRQVEEMTNSEQSNLKATEERDGLINNLSTQLEATQAANVKMVSERDHTIASLSEQITSLEQELSARQQALEAKQAELMKMSDWAFGMMQDLKRVKTPLHVKVADRARGAKQLLRRQLANTVFGDLVRHVRDSRRYRANMVSFDAVARSLQENNGRLIVTFPIITWDFRWQRPQHIVSRLRDQGYSVLYLAMSMNPLQRKFRSAREAGAAIQFNNLGPHVNQIWLHSEQPVNIYTDPLAGDDLYNVVSGLQALLTALKPKSVHYLIQFPGWWPVAEALRQSHGGSVVFDCMDDHGGFSTNTAQALKTEQDLIERANLVITSSALLEDRCRVLNPNTIQVKNGTEFSHFHDPKPNGELDHLKGQPIIGYYGAISDWFDMNIVAHCARARPQWHFVLIGATFGADLSPVEGLPNVHFLGEKPYVSLPGYLAYFDVCTIPFKLIPLTLATNPVKFYEYLSAGKPVVSINLPELMPYADDCYLARNASEFLDLIDSALTENNDPERVSRRLELARENSWDSRAKSILAHPVFNQ